MTAAATTEKRSHKRRAQPAPEPILTEAQAAALHTAAQGLAHRAHLAPRIGSDMYLRNHYRTGDGEVVQPLRPGSDLAMAIPSRGYRT
jgi:hypothetical protein